MPLMFEKLEVYQKAVELINQITSLAQDSPHGYGGESRLLLRGDSFTGSRRFVLDKRRQER